MKQIKNKIIYILPNIPGAHNTTRYQRIDALASAFDLTVILECGPVPVGLRDRASFIVNPVKVRLLRTITFPIWGLAVLLRMRRVGVRSIVSSFHASSTLMGFIGRKLTRAKWIADIYDLPDLGLEVSNSFPFLKRHVSKMLSFLVTYGPHKLYRVADCVLCTLVPEALTQYKISSEKMVLLTNGVDLKNTPRFSEILSDKRGSFRVLYVGFVLRIRGVNTILQAAHILRQRYPDIEWVLIGKSNSTDMAWLESQIVSHSLADTVHLLGEKQHKDVLKMIESSDVCLFPFPQNQATDYIYPVKVFEYMAYGKAIVATALKGVRRVLQHDENALLISPENSSELARAVERLRTEPKLVNQLGLNAARDVSAYDWSIINKRLIAALQEPGEI